MPLDNTSLPPSRIAIFFSQQNSHPKLTYTKTHKFFPTPRPYIYYSYSRLKNDKRREREKERRRQVRGIFLVSIEIKRYTIYKIKYYFLKIQSRICEQSKLAALKTLTMKLFKNNIKIYLRAGRKAPHGWYSHGMAMAMAVTDYMEMC